MRFKCTPCKEEFNFEGQGKPRCPKCLGIHDIEPVAESPSKKLTKKSQLVPIIALAGTAILGVVFLLMYEGEDKKDANGAKQESTIDKSTLPGGLKDLPFAVTTEIEEFAKEATGGSKGDEALKKIFDTISAKGFEGYWRPYHQREPRRGDVLSAKDFLAKLKKKDEKPFEAMSYELTSLMLAMAKSVDVEARIAELIRYRDEKKPADPEGKLGRFGVVSGSSGDVDPDDAFYDIYAHRIVATKDVDLNLLGENEAMAPYYGLKALSLLFEQDTAKAFQLNDAAIGLDPQNPYLHSGRGLIFLASQAGDEAVAEFEKAKKMRDNAVFKINLAEIYTLGDPSGKRAETEIHEALSLMPDYARAHAMMAVVLILQGQMPQAEQELTIAQSLDPDSPSIPMLWAKYYLGKGDSEKAIEKAQRAVDLSKRNPTDLLQLALIYRATARFDEMRATLDEVLKSSDSPVMTKQIKEIFDYSAKSEEQKDSGALGSGLQLKLGEDNAQSGFQLKLKKGLGKDLNLKGGLGKDNLELKLDVNKKK